MSSVGKRRVPRAVAAAMTNIGDNLKLWRRLNRQSIEETAARAGVSVSTVRRLEQGHGATLENLLRVSRVVPCLVDIVDATDPWRSDRGRALAENVIRRG